MTTHPDAIVIATPPMLRPLVMAPGPALLMALVFFASMASGFDPLSPSDDARVWWTGAIIAQVLVFVAPGRWPSYFGAAFVGILAANSLLIDGWVATFLVTVIQWIEPAGGIMIIRYA